MSPAATPVRQTRGCRLQLQVGLRHGQVPHRRSPYACLAEACADNFARCGPVDVDAAVIANTRLSADYNVLALAAPEIARSRGPDSS